MQSNFILIVSLISLIGVSFPTNSSALAFTQTKPEILFIGDSNNKEFNDSLSNYGTPWTEITYIRNQLSGYGWTNFITLTTPQTADIHRIHTQFLSTCPDYMVIIFGAAEIARLKLTGEEAINRAKIVLDYLDEVYTGEIILTSIIFMPMIYVETFNIDGYNSYQTLIADEAIARGYGFVDIFAISENQTGWYNADGVHLNETGVEGMAMGLNEILAPQINVNGTDPMCLPEPSSTTDLSSHSSNEDVSPIQIAFGVISILTISIIKKYKNTNPSVL